MADAAVFRLPAPSLVAFGWESDATSSGTAALSLPVPVLSAGKGNVAFTLPMPTLVANGLTGAIGAANFVLPALAFSATVLAGNSGTAAFVLPAPLLSANGAEVAHFVFPAPQLAATGFAGITGYAVLRAPSMALAAAGTTEIAGAAVFAFPAPRLVATAATGATGEARILLPALALAAQGYTGVIGNAVMTLPVVSLVASGYQSITGSAQLVLPALYLVATGRTAATGVSQAYAMHLEAQALSEYTNFGFNSMARFNGVYLGCTDAGIFAMTGADDAGTAIDAVVRVGTTDFGTSKIKRITRAYVGYKADGEMELRVIADDDTTRRYRLAWPGKTGIHGGHVKIGKGVQARYYQFEIANVNGADFTLNCIEVMPDRLGRRIGNEES